MTTVAYAVLTTDQHWPVAFGTAGHETGGTFVVPPPTAGRVRGTRLRRLDPAGRS